MKLVVYMRTKFFWGSLCPAEVHVPPRTSGIPAMDSTRRQRDWAPYQTGRCFVHAPAGALLALWSHAGVNKARSGLKDTPSRAGWESLSKGIRRCYQMQSMLLFQWSDPYHIDRSASPAHRARPPSPTASKLHRSMLS